METSSVARRRRAETFRVEGRGRIYRCPFRQGRKWRVRRRYLTGDRVECITLKATNLRDAKLEVQAIAAQERTEVEETALRSLSLGDALDRWLAGIQVRPTTAADYRACGVIYKSFFGADRPVGEITLDGLDRFFTRKMGGRTRLKHRAFLKRFFKWAIDRGLARENLPEKIEIQRAWREEARVVKEEIAKPLSRDEARRLLLACSEPVVLNYTRTKKHVGREEKIEAEIKPPGHLRLFVHLALTTGLRLSNLLGGPTKPGLRWRDVDIERGVMRIPREFMKSNNPYEAPLHPEVADILRGQLASLGRVPGSDEQIIAVAQGAEIKKAFAGALRRAGLGHRRIHDLRVSFATWLGAIAPEFVVKRLLGHAKGDVTARYAQNAGIEDVRAWLAKLPGLLATEPSVSAGQKAPSGSGT